MDAQQVEIDSSKYEVKSDASPNFKDALCDVNGGLMYFLCTKEYQRVQVVNCNSGTNHAETQTEEEIESLQPDKKSFLKSCKSKLLAKKNCKLVYHEDFTNGYDFIKRIPSQPFDYVEPQITSWINGNYLPTSSLLICIAMQAKLDKCLLKNFLSKKGMKLNHCYTKSINAVTKVYQIEAKSVIVVSQQDKTNCTDLIYVLDTLKTYLQQRKSESFILTLDSNCYVDKLKLALDYITNCSCPNIKWVLHIPFNMSTHYERALSSRWITGEPSKFLKSTPVDLPLFYADTSADSYFKNSLIEIMFYIKHSDSIIKSHLQNYFKKYIHLMPFAASSLLSAHISIYDNLNNKYLEEPTINHQVGFDGENLVKFCETTNSFSTTRRYIFCSAGTELMLDHLTYNHLNTVFTKDNIRRPAIICIQGVPGCGKSTWIINTHKLGSDLVLCATKEGLADLKSKITARCIKDKTDFNKIVLNYKTIASYLINGTRNYDTVFIDEYMMIHAGYIGLVAMLSKCSKIYLLGDKNQIPYIDRLHHVNMQFYDANKFITNSEQLNVTYRCPVDVTLALKEYYPDISTKNSIDVSMKFIKLPPNIATLPILDNTYYLTFTKEDKRLLIAKLTLPPTSKVLTIHEAQGLTSPNVICVRTKAHPIELFSSLPHLIVAISRHTCTFKYFAPVEDDLLHSLVTKGRHLAGLSVVPGVPTTKTEPSGKSGSKPVTGLCSIYYQNVNKMASKASKFYRFVLQTNYMIYVIGESNFNPGIHSSEYFGHNYVVYRCDRNPETSSKKSGGGVIIAVHSKLMSAPITLVPSGVEQICVKIKINQRYMYIYTAYIPPNSNSDHYAACVDSIEEVINTSNSSDLLLVLGDFNLPNIIWNFDLELNCILPCNIKSDAESIFVDSMLGYNLNQINTITNNLERFLDLVFTNEVDVFKVTESLNPFVVNDVNHKPLDIVFEASDFTPKSKHLQQIKYNFKKTNHSGLQVYLEAVNWDEILNAEDVNENVDKFYEIIHQSFELNVPIYNKTRSVHPPWFDDRLINLKNRKCKAYTKMMKSNLEADKQSFLHHSEEFDVYFKFKYKAYLYGIQEKIRINPKQFWKYFRSKRETEGYPSNMTYNDINTSNSKEIADMFAAFFQSVYRPNVNTGYIDQSSSSNILITSPAISDEDILSALKCFGDGCGPDDIPSSILKTFASILVNPLCKLFNQSLTTAVFPEKWKVSKITPIFKSGKRDDVSCYRGISTSSSIPKLFELVVCNAFKSTLIRHISVNQHGFMPGRSTSTNLVEFTSKVINEIEKHHQVDVAYTDFSKAFDSICHHKALQSLYEFGFSFDYIKWFKSYLTNRLQYVIIDNKKSNVIKVTSGVPQGSHIGPWIFIVFIDRITQIIKNSNVLIFADDVKIYHTIEEICDADKLQDDLNRLSEWCDQNSLLLNIKKCKIMSFHRKKNPTIKAYYINENEVQRVYEITDLGVTFVENVSFNRHIDNCIAKANSMFGFVKRWTGDFNDIQTLLTLYFAYVRSQVEYAAIVWNPYYDAHIKRIESIQKKFLIFLLKKTGWDYDHNIPFYQNVARLPSYSTRCKEYKICTLENRRILLDAAFIGNILLGHIDSAYVLENISINVPGRTLRNHRFLALQHHSTNYGDNNPINRLAKSFNTAEDQFDFNLSKNNFKKKLKTYFLTL